MQITPAAMITWQIAALEAIQSRSKEIEPEHLFIALLKISELSANDLKNSIEQHLDIKQIMDEVESLSLTLKKNNIESALTRRALRHLMGQGNYDHGKEPVHRSSAVREIFQNATVQAQLKGENNITLIGLLNALLHAATPLIGQALGDTLLKKESNEKASWLDQKNLLLKDHSAPSSLNPALQAAAIALHDTLKQNKPIWLVHDADETVRLVIHQTAHLMQISGNSIQYAIYDLFEYLDYPAAQAYSTEKWQAVLAALAGRNNFCLYVPAFYLCPGDLQPDAWSQTLLTCIRTHSAALICRIAPLTLPLVFKIDPAIKRHVNIIHIKDASTQNLPSRL